MNNNFSIRKWLIWSFAAIFYFYEFVLRVSPSIMISELMQSFNITASAVGILSAFYLYAYAPMQLPVGMIMDRYGVKKVLSFASLICGMGAVFFAISQNLPLAGLGRFLIGAGSSFAFIAMVYVTSWFDAKKRAFLIGVANSLAMLGASVGGGPLSTAMQILGWRLMIGLFGMFGLIIGVTIYFLFKEDTDNQKSEDSPKTSFFEGLKSVVIKKNNWINALVALFFYVTTTAFGGLWGVSFLQNVYNVTKETASYAVSMIFIGWLVGGPVVGFWSDFVGKRNTLIRSGILGSLCCLIAVIYFPVIHIYSVYVLLFLLGFFSSAELLNFSVAIEQNSFKVRATAAAFTNFLISCGDAAVQPLIGFFLDRNWTGEMLRGIRVYSANNYQLAMTCLPVTLLIAFMLLFLIKEKQVKKDLLVDVG